VYEPDRFGKLGFKRAWVDRATTINAGMLDEISEELVAKKLAAKEDDGIHVDLGALGVGKLLGEGKVEKALIVKVGSFSEEAKRKIEEAKGRIVSED
jgi:ribosomal protein L15